MVPEPLVDTAGAATQDRVRIVVAATFAGATTNLLEEMLAWERNNVIPDPIADLANRAFFIRLIRSAESQWELVPDFYRQTSVQIKQKGESESTGREARTSKQAYFSSRNGLNLSKSGLLLKPLSPSMSSRYSSSFDNLYSESLSNLSLQSDKKRSSTTNHTQNGAISVSNLLKECSMDDS